MNECITYVIGSVCMYLRMYVCVCMYVYTCVRALLSNLRNLTGFYETRYKLVVFDSNILQLTLPTTQNHKLAISRRH
jgi:hypothetical protein